MFFIEKKHKFLLKKGSKRGSKLNPKSTTLEEFWGWLLTGEATGSKWVKTDPKWMSTGTKLDPNLMQKECKMDPKMESKWNQDIEKESPELILDAMKVPAKKMLQKSQGEVSGPARDGPRRPGSRAWVPLRKGKHEP